MIHETADAIIKELGLVAHIEGGWYAETFRDPATADGRSCSTAIYYLLKEGEVSAWHTVDAAEVWHYYAGAPLDLRIVAPGQEPRRVTLGPDLASGARPQAAAPRGAWQSARSLGAWTLVGCTVAPGFEFMGFRVADAGEAAMLDAAFEARA